jgi:hypothetical protein
LDEDLPLKFTASTGTKITLLKGKFDAMVELGSTNLTIDDLSQSIGKSFSAAGRTLKLSAVQLRERSGSMTFELSRIGTKPPDESLLDEGSNNISLFDADGTFLKTLSTDQHATVNCEISASKPIKPPVRLVYKIVTASKRQTIPFEFRDLPLPLE